MTSFSDLIQILLSEPQPDRWLLVAFAFSLLLLVLRIFGKGLGIVWQVAEWVWAKSPLNIWGEGWFWRVARLAFIVTLTSLFAPQIHDQIQRWEQTRTNPAYIIQHAEPEVAYAYEKQAEQHLTQSELAFFKRRIDEIAAKIGSTPLALMEVGFSECGLNPFAFNVMGGRVVAAGFIQFTSAGLSPLILDGQKVNMEQVKDWCRTRNLERIMACTEVYFDAFAKGRALPRPIDIYLCVFAPAFIGSSPDAVMYERSKWKEAYEGNKYFDGYFVEARNGRQIILRLDSRMDGRITVGELALHLEKKKALLIGGARTKGQITSVH